MLSVGLGFTLGLMIGSLTSCLASRSLTKESFWGRSYCDRCKHKLAWYDLFPIFSYLLLKGKCRYCNARLSLEFPLVELLTGILVSLLFLKNLPVNNNDFINYFSTFNLVNFLNLADLVFQIFVVTVFLIVFITDFKTGLIPNRITYPAVVIAFFYILVLSIARVFFLYTSLAGSILGKYLLPPNSDYFFRHAIINAALFFDGIIGAFVLFAFFGLVILITKGRGMGLGDLKLGIFMGLVLGFEKALLALMIAFINGSVIGIILILKDRKNLKKTIPFGPFLVLGSLLALYYGKEILDWYFRLQF